MTTATKPHSQSINALLDAGLDGAATFHTTAAAPPWAAAEIPRPVAQVEPLPPPRLDKAGLAKQLGMSVRWVEQKMKAGLPHEHIDGRVRFELAGSERWLRDNGHLKAAV
jgi:hypothetical protein